MAPWAFAILALSSMGTGDPPPTSHPRQVAAEDKNKIVCKTWAPTGSLIANSRECRTRHDWDRMRIDTSHIVQGGSCNSAETGTCY